MIEKIEKPVTPLELNSKINEIIDNIAGKTIGEIISVACGSSYIPEGCLPCDGEEYTKAQFPDLWENYLTTDLLKTCTYEDYATDLETYGQCGKFAVDSENEKFRVPYIKDGAVIQQALSDSELGKSYNAGLPNITATTSITDAVTVHNSKQTGAFTTTTGSSKKTAADKGSATTYELLAFDASLSDDIYGASDTVQANAVALRYFVVVANGQLNQSQMDWSAWASGLQLKLNKDHSNDENPYVKETYINEASGYRIWSDGYCEQWGMSVTNSTSWFEISLLKEYSNNVYGCLAINTGSSDTIYNVKTGDNNKNTTTSLYLKCNNSSTSVRWKTFGYLAEGEY